MAAGRRAPGRTFETSRGILLKKKVQKSIFQNKDRTEAQFVPYYGYTNTLHVVK